MTTMNPVQFEINAERVVQSLQQVGEKLDSSGGEVMLDFAVVQRIDPSALRALEQLARMAEAKSVKVSLHGVSVEIYKVLKLSRLTSRLAFVN